MESAKSKCDAIVRAYDVAVMELRDVHAIL